MERKIGETFEFEGKTLQVKADSNDGCEGCIFNVKCTRGIKSVTGLCRSDYRDDKKDVIFVEVKERKIGEVFESRGKKLKVTEHRSDCIGCFFDGQFKSCLKEETGECGEYIRSDHKSVIFVEVKDEQQQEQAEQPQTEQPPQKLNLCEILKDCPMYEPFWSPMLGDVKFHHIDHEAKRILITLKTGTQWNINPDATITFANVTSPEIMLYPSKEQRDWSKFTAPWLKKERFDPKTLKPFDKVIFKGHGMWFCGLFSHIHNSYACVGETYYKCVIPYNDDTKHLVGTTDEAPKFYRYWED